MLMTSNYFFLDALHFTLLYPNNTSFVFPRCYIRTASANISFIETNEQFTVYGAIIRTFRGLFVDSSSFRSPNFSLAFLNYTHLFPITSNFRLGLNLFVFLPKLFIIIAILRRFVLAIFFVK